MISCILPVGITDIFRVPVVFFSQILLPPYHEAETAGDTNDPYHNGKNAHSVSFYSILLRIIEMVVSICGKKPCPIQAFPPLKYIAM
jgi:hypothetical protein